MTDPHTVHLIHPADHAVLEAKAAAFDALTSEQKARAARLALAKECYRRVQSAEAWAELQGERRR